MPEEFVDNKCNGICDGCTQYPNCPSFICYSDDCRNSNYTSPCSAVPNGSWDCDKEDKLLNPAGVVLDFYSPELVETLGIEDALPCPYFEPFTPEELAEMETERNMVNSDKNI